MLNEQRSETWQVTAQASDDQARQTKQGPPKPWEEAEKDDLGRDPEQEGRQDYDKGLWVRI